MTRNTTLAKHYSQLLGLSAPWRIQNIVMNAAQQKIDISIEWPSGKRVRCPECGTSVGSVRHSEQILYPSMGSINMV